MKKVLSIFLCAVMLLGSFSLFASATEAPAAVDARSIGGVYGQRQLYIDRYAASRNFGYMYAGDDTVLPGEYPVSYTVTASELNANSGNQSDVAATGIQGWTISMGIDDTYFYFAAEVNDPQGLAKDEVLNPETTVAEASASSFRFYIGIANGGDWHDVHSYFYCQPRAWAATTTDRYVTDTAWGFVSKDGTAAPSWSTNYSSSTDVRIGSSRTGDITTYEGMIPLSMLKTMFGVDTIDAFTMYGESVTRGTKTNPTETAEVRLNDKVNIPQHVCDSIDAYYGAKEPARIYKGAGKWLPRATAWVRLTNDDGVIDSIHDDMSGWGQDHVYANPAVFSGVTADGVVSAGEYNSCQDFDLATLNNSTHKFNSYALKPADAVAEGFSSWKNYFAYNDGILYMASVIDYDHFNTFATNPVEGMPTGSVWADYTRYAFCIAPATGAKNAVEMFEAYRFSFIMGLGDETCNLTNIAFDRAGQFKLTYSGYSTVNDCTTDTLKPAMVHGFAGYDNGVTTIEVAIDLAKVFGSAPEKISFFHELEEGGAQGGLVFSTEATGVQAEGVSGGSGYQSSWRWLSSKGFCSSTYTNSNTGASAAHTPYNISHICYLTGKDINTANAIVTKDAASIRLGNDGHNGLRFTSVIDYALFEQLVAVYGRENITVGHLIAPESYVKEAGAFTKDALDALGKKVAYRDVVTDSFLKNDQGNYVFAGSLVDILDQNLDRNFAAIGYIQIGDGEIIYSSSYTVRNVSDIAAAALTDVQAEQCADYCYAVAGEDTYSPYDTEQRKFLADLVKAN